MLTNQFFKKLVRRVLVVKDRNSSGLSKIVLARKDQAVRNGNHLTVISFGSRAILDGKTLPDKYQIRRIMAILSKICIEGGIVFYFIDKEFSLLLETTLEESERILFEAAVEFKKEDIRLTHTSVILV